MEGEKTELLHEVCPPDWQDIPLGPGQAPGPQGLGAIIGAFTAAFPDVEVVIHELFGTHERAGARAEIRFTICPTRSSRSSSAPSPTVLANYHHRLG